MIINTAGNTVLFDTKMHEMPEYWPFHLMHAVFGEKKETELYLQANLAGIFEALNSLDDCEKIVILLRFKDRMTLTGVGEKLGVNSERVRQIEAKALRRLRHPSRAGKMIAVNRVQFKELERRNGYLKAEIAQMKKTNCTAAEILSIGLEDMDLSVRAFNCLKRGGLNCVGDIASLSAPELIKVRNLGRKSFEEVINKLAEFGITLSDMEAVAELGFMVSGTK